MDEVLDAQAGKLAITRRIAGDIRTSGRCSRASTSAPARRPTASSSSRATAPAGISQRLRAQAGEISMEIVDWWDDFAHAGPDEARGAAAPGAARRPRRRRRSAVGASANRPARTPPAADAASSIRPERSSLVRAYVAFGANLGDPVAAFFEAVQRLDALPAPASSRAPRCTAALRWAWPASPTTSTR